MQYKSKKTKEKVKKTPTSGVIVKGIDNCLVRLAKCCNPLPGDEILGYITKGRGVSIHRANCVNTKDLLNDEERMIEVSWFEETKEAYNVELEIFATDRNGLLKDIIKQIENSNDKIIKRKLIKFNSFSISFFVVSL